MSIKELQNLAIKNGWHEGNNGLFTNFPINNFLTKEQFQEYLELSREEE